MKKYNINLTREELALLLRAVSSLENETFRNFFTKCKIGYEEPGHVEADENMKLFCKVHKQLEELYETDNGTRYPYLVNWRFILGRCYGNC